MSGPADRWARLRLERELTAWSRAGHTPLFWWRDDDARTPTPALDRLLEVSQGVPLGLAIIPDGDLTGLARVLQARPDVVPGQHGVDHQSRRPEGEAPCEHPADADPRAVAERIGEARAHMIAAGLEPRFYTPPWNRLDAPLPEALALSGHGRVSAWDTDETTLGPLARRDAHLDVLRWGERPRFRGEARLLHRLRRLLAERRRTGRWDAPVGLLTHHLAHDEAAWRFLEGFAPFVRSRMRVTGP